MNKIYCKLYKSHNGAVMYGKYTISELNKYQDAGWLWKRIW